MNERDAMQAASVIGLGYVGLTMAVCLGNRGIRTTGVDVDELKLGQLRRGDIPFYEPELQEMLTEALTAKTVVVTDNIQKAASNSDVTFITVGTPSNSDGSINLDQVRAASTRLGLVLKTVSRYHLVVVRSTVTPGTTQQVVKTLLENSSGKSCGADFGLCANPEFLSEGQAIRGTMNPDRIIIGECDTRAGDTLQAFYARFHGRQMPAVLRTTPINSELIKYASNAFLATKVSFINSIANLCERVIGTNVDTIAKGIGMDPRIGASFLRAGIGWGGSCFPKDVDALRAFAKGFGVQLPIIDAAVAVNERQSSEAVRLASHLIGPLRGKRVAILGIAFKPNTDDTREASALKVVDELLGAGAEVTVYDPRAMQKVRAILGDRVRYAKNATQCMEEADCCILATEWDEFKKLESNDFLKMRIPAVVDGRRFLNPAQFKSRMKYVAIGQSGAK
jgi:UDPglucose 6-dehydrogenase